MFVCVCVYMCVCVCVCGCVGVKVCKCLSMHQRVCEISSDWLTENCKIHESELTSGPIISLGSVIVVRI